MKRGQPYRALRIWFMKKKKKRRGRGHPYSLNLRLNGSIRILLALGISTQCWPGYAGTLPAISKSYWLTVVGTKENANFLDIAGRNER